MKPIKNNLKNAQSNSHIAEACLLEQIIEHSCEKSLTILYNHYFTLLCNSIITIIYCPLKAQEVVTDVFLKTWTNRANLNKNLNLKQYLKASVRNGAIDLLRRNKKYSYIVSLDDIKIYSNRNKEDDHLIEILFVKELDVFLESAIDSLPSKAKEIFRMSRYDGLKYKEIAQKLSLSQKTVETQMSRSLVTLRKIVGGSSYEYLQS